MTRPAAIVTGASRGIGKAIALRLAREGFHLALAARTQGELEAAASECRAEGTKALAVPTDVTSEDDVKRLFGETLGRFGRLDVLVNNAGGGVYKPVAETSLEEFEGVMAVNARGTFLCSREAMRIMTAPREGEGEGRGAGGIIVNMSSVVGIKGYPNQGAYTAAKHAVVGLSKTLAEEGRERGVRVHVICPGGVATELIASARPDIDPSELLAPEDVADLVAYLVKLPENAMIDLVHLRRASGKPF
ncbi:MAG: SDR family NAD(P)-dependent oxidoreductase [Planctomycetota bacterium]